MLERIRELIGPAASRTSRRRTCSRSRRRAPSARATRGTCTSTARRSSAALCERHFSSVDLLGLFHARKLRATSGRSSTRAGTRSTPSSASPSRSTTASRRRSRCATSRCGGEPGPRAGLPRGPAPRSPSRSRSDRRSGRYGPALHKKRTLPSPLRPSGGERGEPLGAAPRPTGRIAAIARRSAGPSASPTANPVGPRNQGVSPPCPMKTCRTTSRGSNPSAAHAPAAPRRARPAAVTVAAAPARSSPPRR